MPHVAFVSFSGVRVKEVELAEMGATLPGLRARTDAVGRLPALGLLTLAGMLPVGWTCSYREADGPLDRLTQVLSNERPDLVAMSALTASVDQAYALAARLRSENIHTALGGLHATACPDEAAQHIDAVCCGEGELIWPKLLRDLDENQLQPSYQAVRTAGPLAWSLPRFELLAGKPVPRWTLQTQRGCPLACEFCAASRTISRFREKPVDQIRNELAAISAISPNPLIELADDNSFAGERDPAPLLDALTATRARFFTEADWRIGERPELLVQLAAAGCVQVLVGIESLVFRFPGMGAKQAELARVMRACERIQDAGIAVNGCFIVGADGETLESIARLGDFLRACELADVQLTLSTPFPGTPLYARLKHAGRLLLQRGWSHYTLFDVTFQPDRLSIRELELAYRELMTEVYDKGEARRRERVRHQVWRRNSALRGDAWTQ
jgi:radical SAM superfamily enzyme YgiQ (UPF0313 family)